MLLLSGGLFSDVCVGVDCARTLLAFSSVNETIRGITEANVNFISVIPNVCRFNKSLQGCLHDTTKYENYPYHRAAQFCSLSKVKGSGIGMREIKASVAEREYSVE